MKKYNLTISESQARLISLALDIYSRMEAGKLSWALSMVHWRHRENFLKAEPLIEEINKLLTGLESGSFGIEQVSADARMAYDLHQVIRHQITHDNKKEDDSKLSVYLDEPRQFGEELLAVISALNE